MTGIHRLSKKDTAPGVGRDIDAHCTRCKMELGHTIVAMVGAAVVQVRCNTCGGTHKYRTASSKPGSEGARRQRVARAARSGGAALAAAQRRFQRRLDELDEQSAIGYSPRISPEVGALVRHAKFGLGIVNAVLGGKATIEFADGEKLLVIGR